MGMREELMKQYFYLINVFLLLFSLIHAQNLPKFSGFMFGDYYYNLSFHNQNQKGMNGFQFRRIFITADYTISEKFNSRFRIEADNIFINNSSGNKMNIWVKDAFLEWVDFFDGSNLYFGISPTPAFEVSTKLWNHRFIEKTILDYNGLVSSRDMGIDLRGNIINNGKIKYWIKFGNNANSGPENNNQKRIYGLLEFYLLNNIVITFYNDFTTLSSIFDESTNSIKYTNGYLFSLFFNYKYKNFSLGVESLFRKINNGYKTNTLEDLNTYGVSFWSFYQLNERVTLVSRYDYFDYNSIIKSDDYSLVILAFDYKPYSKVHICPNCEIKIYKDNCNEDIVPRISFFWEY